MSAARGLLGNPLRRLVLSAAVASLFVFCSFVVAWSVEHSFVWPLLPGTYFGEALKATTSIRNQAALQIAFFLGSVAFWTLVIYFLAGFLVVVRNRKLTKSVR
jgi:hypothetical protein